MRYKIFALAAILIAPLIFASCTEGVQEGAEGVSGSTGPTPNIEQLEEQPAQQPPPEEPGTPGEQPGQGLQNLKPIYSKLGLQWEPVEGEYLALTEVQRIIKGTPDTSEKYKITYEDKQTTILRTGGLSIMSTFDYKGRLVDLSMGNPIYTNESFEYGSQPVDADQIKMVTISFKFNPLYRYTYTYSETPSHSYGVTIEEYDKVENKWNYVKRRVYLELDKFMRDSNVFLLPNLCEIYRPIGSQHRQIRNIMITPIIKDGVVSSWGDYLYKYYDASSDSIKEIKVTYQTDTKPMMDVESPAGRFQSVLEKVDADSIKEDIYQCFDPTCIGTKRILRETRIFKFEKITTPPLMPPPGGDVMPFLGIWTEFSRGSAIFMESPEVLVGNYGIGLVPLFKFQVP